jgi:hypothetical protein
MACKETRLTLPQFASNSWRRWFGHFRRFADKRSQQSFGNLLILRKEAGEFNEHARFVAGTMPIASVVGVPSDSPGHVRTRQGMGLAS